MAHAIHLPSLTVRPLTGSLGAVIEGVSVDGNLAPEQVELIREALLVHRVVFFREQHRLDDAGQRAFASLLGPVTAANPLTGRLGEGEDQTVAIDSLHFRANEWHSDATFLDRPPAFSVLRAIKLPQVGGDTVWANTVRAYAALSPTLQRMITNLRARHDNRFDYAVHTDRSSGFYQSKDYGTVVNASLFEAEHAIARVHPETGEGALLLGMFAKCIVGLNKEDSRETIALLQRHIEKPDNLVRWRWARGDIVIWDNRSTQHYAISDYSEHRLMRRVTVAGNIPVGLNGTRSTMITGDCTVFSEIFEPPPRKYVSRSRL